MEITKLAFLETYSFDNNAGIMGAILVTDADTKPLEFRVTAPIKPTNFQKTLYGDVLLEHILVELIAVPLLGAVKEEIDIIIVRDPLFLGVNNKQGIRVVRVFKEQEGKSKGNKISEQLDVASGEKDKSWMEITKKFEHELPEIKSALENLAENRNLIEPFDRLKIACEQVHLQKTGD